MEQPVKLLKPLNRIPFTLAVFMRLIVLIPLFGVSILMTISGYQEIQQFGKLGLLTFFSGIFAFIFSSVSLINLFFLKKWKLSQLHYLIYPDRLVIYNHVRDKIIHELPFDDFPTFTFYENLNNFGYIVIGTEKSILTRSGFSKHQWGINMADPEIVLENLQDVRQIYVLLRESVDSAKKSL